MTKELKPRYTLTIDSYDALDSMASFVKRGCKELRFEIDPKLIDLVAAKLKEVANDRVIHLNIEDDDVARIFGWATVGAAAVAPADCTVAICTGLPYASWYCTVVGAAVATGVGAVAT